MRRSDAFEMILGPAEWLQSSFDLIGLREEFGGTIVGDGEPEQEPWGREKDEIKQGFLITVD